MRCPLNHSRAGFSLIEALIAVSLVTVLLVNTTVLLHSTQDANSASREQFELRSLADSTLDRIVLELMEADKEVTLPQNAAPNHSSQVNYRSSLGLQDGDVVYSDPARIWFELADSQVIWTRNSGAPGAQDVVWGRHVRDFLFEEQGANLADDNANGLVDEFGLSFDIEDDSVVVRLTLEKVGKNGELLEATAETRAAFRN